ncbi:hypothetical protein [Sporosarcina sp. FSL K6-1508]|uniref:hypothetical protein n=1 Tax=Sporosarcina sp. FSL K6-1508 TaxID=2921553 RepID=UPI0030F873CF
MHRFIREIYYYHNAKGVKLWGYRHRYYDALDKRRKKSAQGLVSETVVIRAVVEVKTNLTVSEWMDIWYEQTERQWAVSTRSLRSGIISD